MGMNFHDFIVQTLEKVGKPLSAVEIWDKGCEFGFNEQLRSNGRTPWETIASYVYVDLKKRKSKYIKVGKRPTLFGLKAWENEGFAVEETNAPTVDPSVPRKTFNERDLHPLLVKFLAESEQFQAHAKTIYHERSNKGSKGKHEWMHPDIVGVYFPFAHMEAVTLKVQKTFETTSFRLYSFELKIEVDFSSLRESFFQAVSNSSWAHEGYLVALRVDRNADFLKEFRRLNNAFGIGLIQLNAENIHESEVLFNSRPQQDLDWETIDILTGLNPDFKSFLQEIIDDAKVDKARGKYDRVLSDDEFEKFIQQKGFIS